jgi:hypothetical protein
MGLVICGECEAAISHRAKRCPSCGAPCIPMSHEQYAERMAKVEAARDAARRHDMKWWFIFIGALVFIGWLGSKSSDDRKAEQDRQFIDSVNNAEQRKKEKESKDFWSGVGIQKQNDKKR